MMKATPPEEVVKQILQKVITEDKLTPSESLELDIKGITYRFIVTHKNGWFSAWFESMLEDRTQRQRPYQIAEIEKRLTSALIADTEYSPACDQREQNSFTGINIKKHQS